MVLEATMICVDNSEWTRNGDYGPTRWESEQDAANIICEAKTQQNPESTVGIISMAGKMVDVQLTPTTDIGRLLAAVQSIKIQGNSDFITAVQIAQLALKHRQNTNQRQRIVMFAGSPVTNDARELVALGKKLKKNNVAIDVINFGQMENAQRLEELVKAANNSNNSHFINIPPGVTMISDALITSPIINEDEGAGYGDASGAAAGAGGGGAGGDLGDIQIDPNMDPELAMAIRLSMEEERARQERAKKQAEESKGTGEPAVESNKMQDVNAQDDFENMTEEELLEQAKFLSMQGETEIKKPEEKKVEKPAELAPVFQDTSFVKDLLNNLPGVDLQNADIQKALESLSKKDESKKEEDKKKEDDK